MEDPQNRDLDIKIGTPEGVKWREVLEVQRQNLATARVIRDQAEILIPLAEKKIAEENLKIENTA